MRWYAFLLLFICSLASGAAPEATGKDSCTAGILIAGTDQITERLRWDQDERRLSAPAATSGEYRNVPDTDSTGRHRNPVTAPWWLPVHAYAYAGIFTGYCRSCAPQSNTVVYSFIRSLIFPEHSFW